MSALDDDRIPCGESCWAEDGDGECVCGVGTEDGTRPAAAYDWRVGGAS